MYTSYILNGPQSYELGHNLRVPKLLLSFRRAMSTKTLCSLPHQNFSLRILSKICKNSTIQKILVNLTKTSLERTFRINTSKKETWWIRSRSHIKSQMTYGQPYNIKFIKVLERWRIIRESVNFVNNWTSGQKNLTNTLFVI